MLKDVQTKITKGEYLGIYENKKVPFEDYALQCKDYSKANKAWSTYNRRDRFSIINLITFFKGKYLYEITPQMIEKYKAKRLENISPSTVNREVACLKHMFTLAIEWGLIKASPAQKIKHLKEPPGRLRYLNPDEVKTLLSSCSSYLVTALNTGMRKSEILKMKWSEVDLRNRKITVINSKNNESRVIPINQTLYSELMTLKEKRRGEYVFTNSEGYPFGDIKKGFSAAVKRAEIKDFRFHDLRHTFGSHLVMQGVDLRTVQHVLGHKDIQMTMHYSHLSPEYIHEAMERLDNLWTLYGHQNEYGDMKDHVSN